MRPTQVRMWSFLIVMAVALSALAAACGGEPEPTATTAPTATPTEPQPGQTAEPTEPPTEEPTATPEPEFTFEGKTVELTIGSAPGGGTDTTARLLARVLPKYLPGEPDIIVRNRPSAVANSNYVFNQADPNTVISVNSSSMFGELLAGSPHVQYTMEGFTWIGNLNRGVHLTVVRDTAEQNLFDSGGDPLFLGTSGAGNQAFEVSMILGAEHLGWDIKFVVGYAGTAEIALAFQRGEVDAMGTNTVNLLEPLIEDHGAVPWASVLSRSDFPLPEEKLWATRVWDRPEMPELDRRVVDQWFAGASDKTINASPNMDPQVAEIWREAFRQAVEDPEFRPRAVDAFGPALAWQEHDEIKETLVNFVQRDPDVKARISELREKYGLPQE